MIDDNKTQLSISEIIYGLKIEFANQKSFLIQKFDLHFCYRHSFSNVEFYIPDVIKAPTL